MLLFYCCAEEALPVVRREGIRSPDGVSLWTSLEAAAAECGEAILVVSAQPGAEEDGRRQVHLPAVPPEAVLNADPYRPPRPVEAAGGYVMRSGRAEPELLVIFRRGRWDLPKGKLDAGESIEACALREVREEVGIDTLAIRARLGHTLHAYPEYDLYRVKTTHWFLMETPERDFTPQADEDIEAVEWMPWREARQRIGYAPLRAHMAQVESVVYAQPWLSASAP